VASLVGTLLWLLSILAVVDIAMLVVHVCSAAHIDRVVSSEGVQCHVTVCGSASWTGDGVCVASGIHPCSHRHYGWYAAVSLSCSVARQSCVCIIVVFLVVPLADPLALGVSEGGLRSLCKGVTSSCTVATTRLRSSKVSHGVMSALLARHPAA
jgi:hypothetical protein